MPLFQFLDSTRKNKRTQRKAENRDDGETERLRQHGIKTVWLVDPKLPSQPRPKHWRILNQL